ncbi:uncharacterized protein LOC126549053 [Aphis gossypii]|uniref:uncharacterized protein LOC126549053 n=1 Tax=Aphis gossypii TaxID=80765 RepID=UPI00215962BA|nr:uncharacterized protein LOC126549053 [Aphis gossypii]
MEFIKSNKNKLLLVYNSYAYREEKIYKESKYWKCIDMQCKGRLTTTSDNNKIKKEPSEHNHVPDICKLEVKKEVERMKSQALSSQDNPQQIIASSQLNPMISGALPEISNLKHTLRRVRQRNDCAPPNPQSLFNLQIPERYTLTKDGKQFMQYDSGPSDERILIFFTGQNLELMGKYNNWFVDGTFKCTPTLFTQIYTIHVLTTNSLIPAVYALLPNKSQKTYVHLLNQLKKIKSTLSPKLIMSDFEMASINAFKEVFPNLKQKGCHFHFSQCIWRKIQQIQYMAQKYISDSTFALQIRLLLALAYVPENHVIDAFEELIDSQYYTDNEKILQPLIDYFEDTWVGRPMGRRKGRRLPKYSISLWNCYESASTLLPRTNNAVEGWHRGFSSLLGAYHPTLWTFIDVLKDQQHLEDIKQEQFIAGAKKHQKKKYKDCSER